MGKHKDKYKPKAFESTGISSDTSANIYMSMLMSDNWHKLTKNQQILYLYCKAQYYAEKRKPKPLVAELTDSELSRCFTMNKSKWCQLYNIYNDGNQASFIKDMNALIDKGFVELIESGKTTRTKSIYMLSSKWQGST